MAAQPPVLASPYPGRRPRVPARCSCSRSSVRARSACRWPRRKLPRPRILISARNCARRPPPKAPDSEASRTASARTPRCSCRPTSSTTTTTTSAFPRSATCVCTIRARPSKLIVSIYDQRAKRLHAEGNARLTDADGKISYGDVIDLSDDYRDGFVDSLRVETPDQTRIAAARAERSEGNFTVFQSGVYTACEPCKDDPRKPPLGRSRQPVSSTIKPRR